MKVLVVLFCALVCSCQPKNKAIEIRKKVTEIKNTKALKFKEFLDKINTDCEFQRESILFPLEEISLMDYGGKDVYDTIYIEKENYECLHFTSPKSNIVEGKASLNFIHKSKVEKIIQLNVEDSGIRIQYFFRLEASFWKLVKIVDQST